MTSRIIAFEDILEDIRKDGLREARGNRVAMGLLTGERLDDSIIILERRVLPSGKINRTFSDAFWEGLYDFFSFPELIYQSIMSSRSEQKLKKSGKIPVRVFYHTLPFAYSSSWSSRELETSRPKLLYATRGDKFLALNEKGEDIPVIMVRMGDEEYETINDPKEVKTYEWELSLVAGELLNQKSTETWDQFLAQHALIPTNENKTEVRRESDPSDMVRYQVVPSYSARRSNFLGYVLGKVLAEGSLEDNPLSRGFSDEECSEALQEVREDLPNAKLCITSSYTRKRD